MGQTFDGDKARIKAKRPPTIPPKPCVTILDAHQQPVTQAAYDALVMQRDRLLRLCQTHGLMVG